MEPTIYKPSIYKGAGIYKTGAGGSNLPEGYEQKSLIRNKVEFNSFGNSININKNFANKSNYTFAAKFYMSELEHNYNLAAPIFKTNTSYSILLDIDDNTLIYRDGGVQTSTGITSYQNTIVYFGVSNGRLINLDNGTKIPGSVNHVEQNAANILLLGGVSNRKVPKYAQELYNFKIFDNITNEVLINCVPVINTNENKIGVFDTITKTFFEANSSYYEVI